MRRLAILAATALGLLLAAPHGARAGTYDLLACDAMPNHSFGAWQMERATANGTMAVYASGCDGDPAKVNNMDGNGLISRSGYDSSWTAWNDGRGWRLQPAPGTRILGLAWAGTLQRPGTPSGTEGWTTEMADAGNGMTYLACPPGTGSCSHNYPSPTWFPLPNGASGTGIRVGSYCRPALPAQCWNARTTLFFNTAAAALARVRYADVRVQDTSIPSLALTGGGLTAGGWLRGAQDVSYTSSDNSGVRANRLYVDGVQQGADAARACDFTGSVPCPGSIADAYTTNTAALADGSHTFRVETVDAAGNVNGDTEAFSVDNHAPAAPAGITADGGGVAATPSFTLRFTNPTGQAAPIATAHYNACSSSGCHSGTAAVSNGASGQPDSISGSFGIDQPGASTVTVWLEDAAGNADPASAAAPVRLQLGEDKPAPPQLAAPPTGWISAPSYTQRIGYPADAPAPPSGVGGYAVTTDGSAPGATVNAAGRDASYAFAPAEGITTIRARSVSGAGTTSDVSQVTLRVDRTAPVTSVLGAGAPGAVTSGSLDITLLGTDQPGLSGMGGADAGQPVAAGGHVDYALDGGDFVQVRGDEAHVHLETKGTHTIAFRAYDVAQNASPLRAVEVTVGAPSDPKPGMHAGFWDESTSTATFTAAPSFGTSCPREATLTATATATIDEAAPATASTTLTVRSRAGGNARLLLSFDLPAAGDCTVTSAELRLWQEDGASGRTLAAYRLGSSWSASAVTWDNRPGATGEPATTKASGSGPQTFDVTEQVRGMYRSGNDGFVIQDASEGSAAEQLETFSGPQLVLTFG